MTEKAPLPKHIGDRNSRDFTLTALVELPILAAGYFLFQRTGDLFWLIGAQAIGAAILLCSEGAGSFITGTSLYVDGGFTGMRL